MPPEACETTPLPEQTATLISLLASAVGRDETLAFRDCPLTPQQFALARTLAKAGPLMLSEIARVCCCVPANITGLVDRLERKGLARRLSDPSDRRVTRVALTDAGERALAETTARISPRPSRLVAAISGEEMRTLVDLLGRLYLGLDFQARGDAASGERDRSGDRQTQEEPGWTGSPAPA
jgi:DNA-binding MarR family transcriptional regulator